jgi:hypothetical protein
MMEGMASLFINITSGTQLHTDAIKKSGTQSKTNYRGRLSSVCDDAVAASTVCFRSAVGRDD